MNKYISFEVIRDDYCVYETENGQILRLKQSILNITQTDNPDPAKQNLLNTKSILSCVMTKEIDTSDLVESTHNKTLESDQTHELKFKIIKEHVNVYETKRSIILVSSHIFKIFATTKKDDKGEPILRFKAVHDISVIKKSEFNDEELSKNDDISKRTLSDMVNEAAKTRKSG